jgi:thiol-disulfide isomerase/thioredoxin
MVVNLWASWCGPCREELPILQRFSQEYDGRVAVLGIDYEDVQPKAALELARDSGVTYPLLADPQASLSGAAPFPALRGLPFLALVDADGDVVHSEFVAIGSTSELERLVEEHLGVAAP